MIECVGFGLVFCSSIHANQDRYLPFATAAVLDPTRRPRLAFHMPARFECCKRLGAPVTLSERIKRSIVPNRITEAVTLNRLAQLADVMQLCVSRPSLLDDAGERPVFDSERILFLHGITR